MSEYSESEMLAALARMREKVEAEAYARGKADGQKMESEVYTRALQLVQLGVAINGTVRNIPIVPVPPTVLPEPAPYHQINRAEPEVKAEPIIRATPIPPLTPVLSEPTPTVQTRAIPTDPAHRTHSVMGLHHAIEEAHANGDHHYAHQLRAVQADALDEAGAHREATLQRVIAHLHGGPDTPGSLPPETLAATFKNRSNLERVARRRTEAAHDATLEASGASIEAGVTHAAPGDAFEHSWNAHHFVTTANERSELHTLAADNHTLDGEYHDHQAGVAKQPDVDGDVDVRGAGNHERARNLHHHAREQHFIAAAYQAAAHGTTEGDQGRGAKSLPDESLDGDGTEVKAKFKGPADPAKALELSEAARGQSERAYEDFPTGHEFDGEAVHHHDAHEFAKIGDWESAAESHRSAEVTHLKHHLAAGGEGEKVLIEPEDRHTTDEAREHLKAADLHRDAHDAITGKDSRYITVPTWAKQYHQTLTDHGFELNDDFKNYFQRTTEERITAKSKSRSAHDLVYHRLNPQGGSHQVWTSSPKQKDMNASAGIFQHVSEHTPEGVRKDKWNFDTHDQLAAHLESIKPQAKSVEVKADGTSDPAPHGYCPECKEPGTSTQRHIGAPIFCGNGHEFPKDKAKFSFTGVNLPPDVADQITAVQRFIPDEDLGPDGKEKEAHVTVRYGLHTSNPADVEKVAAGTGAIHLELDGLGHFSGPKQDVVYAKVTGRGLHDLNEKLGVLPHTDTHPGYTPHATIAYVKPGMGPIYAAGLPTIKGSTVVDRLEFSDPKKNKASINLGG